MCPKYCVGHTYTKKLFVICLKFEFNWASCILPGNAVALISWFFSCDGHLSLCLASLGGCSHVQGRPLPSCLHTSHTRLRSCSVNAACMGWTQIVIPRKDSGQFLLNLVLAPS